MYILIDGKPKMEIDNVDIQIGAVELKNAVTDDRALISDASTARASTNHVLSVQHLDATGKVQPAGDLVGNGIFVRISDGTTVPVVETAGTKKALDVNITDGTYDMPTGDALARGIFVNIGDGTTTAVVETAGTKKALNVNISDGTNDMPTMDANSRAGFVQVTDGTREVDIIATINSLKSDVSSIAGTATNVNGGNRDAGTQTITLADNDPAVVALQLIDNPVIVDDSAFTPATSSVMMFGAEFDDTSPDTVNEGDAGAVRMSANRNLFTTIRDAAGNERGVNVTSSNNLTVDVNAQTLTAIKVSATAAANTVSNPIFSEITDGTTGVVVETAGTKKALNVNVTDGTNDMPTGDAVGRSLYTAIGDGTQTVDVEALEADIDTKNAITTNSLIYGKESAGVTHPLLCNASGVLSVDVSNDSEVATTPVIYNVEMTNLDTQYSQALPANTKILEFNCREEGFDVRYSFETGKVATPTAPYKTLKAGAIKTVDGLNLTSKTLYFACGTAAKNIEIECWS